MYEVKMKFNGGPKLRADRYHVVKGRKVIKRHTSLTAAIKHCKKLNK